MRTIKRNIVSALIISQDNKIFMGRKDPEAGGVYPDCWHLPGGGIDPGESPLEAVIREVREEVGIDISTYNPTPYDYQDVDTFEKVLKDTKEKILCLMTFTMYKVLVSDQRADETNIHLGDDLVRYAWFDLASLSTIKLPPPSVNFFNFIKYSI